MAAPLTTGLPLQHHLDGGWKISFTALDPATGAEVTSVQVSNATMLVELLTDVTPDVLQVGPFMLVPGPQS